MKRYSEQSGFSLIEVLVVITIMVILAGALLGIARRLKEQANEKLCKGTIQILVAAIEQYYDYHGEFPVYDPLLAAAEEVAPYNPYAIEVLYDRLNSLSSSRKLCAKIQASLIGDTDVDLATGSPARDGKFEFLDPWGTPIRYRYVQGNTFPELISAGPDLGFGDIEPTPNGTTVDNISSK